MAKPNINKPQQERPNGLFVKGIVISHSARTIRSKKDNELYGLITHELAMQPGVINLEQMVKPSEDPRFKVQGDEVIDYPHFMEFEVVEVRAGKLREYQGRMTASNYELIPVEDEQASPATA